ncbi:transcriptional regulator with XRE-family HTH domain [Nitrobacteraceae bacterium AZCC 2161]|jgi:transcriptional regulator with XRE-family HTH domain
MLKKKRPIPKQAPAAQPGGNNEYLGVRLRHGRMTKGLRLKDLAEAADCSESMISKIENGRAVPSLNALYRIAEVLELTVGQLFEKPSEPSGLLSRAGERPMVKTDPLRNGPGLTLERLIPYDKARLLQGSIHNIAPGGSGGGLVTHEGEEVAYVIEGQVELMVGDAKYLLNTGDSICYRSEQPHGYRNGTDSPARVIIVNTPPSF